MLPYCLVSVYSSMFFFVNVMYKIITFVPLRYCHVLKYNPFVSLRYWLVLYSQFLYSRLRFASLYQRCCYCQRFVWFGWHYKRIARGACAALGSVYTPDACAGVYVYTTGAWAAELHLDVSVLQRPVLLLDVYTPQWPKLHLDVSTLQRPVLHLNMSTHRGRSCTVPGPVNTTEACAASGHRGRSCTWSCQHYKGLCCI